MSIFDRGYAAFKRLVLMDDKIERTRDDISELKSIARDHEGRLIRMETIVQIGLSGAAPAEQPRLPG